MIIYVVLTVIIVLLIIALVYVAIKNRNMRTSIIELKQIEENLRQDKYNVTEAMYRCVREVDSLSQSIRNKKVEELVEDGEGYVKYRGCRLQKFSVINVDIHKHNENMENINIEGMILEKKEEGKYDQ